jgi:hypothetical protein
VTATRILSRPSGRVVAVRRARVRVSRGPARGEQLELSTLSPIVVGSDPDADLVLADDTVSGRHAEIRPTARGWTVRDLGSTNGVVINDVRVGEAQLDERTRRLQLGESELEWKLYDDEVEHLLAATPFGGLVGDAPPMRALFARLEQAAPADTTVLLEGESGTGKEVLAEALHRGSPRAERPFIVVDCGSLAPNLVESELFGHEKGAFTGADRARRCPRGGPRRHPVPRRDRRIAARAAGQALARARGARGAPRRSRAPPLRRRARDRGDTPPARSPRRRRAVPRRSLLPPRRHQGTRAGAARAARGRLAAGAPLSGRAASGARSLAAALRRGLDGADLAPLAR